GLWLLIPLPIVYYIQLPTKYLLACMPAVILTCFRLGSVVPGWIARTASILLIIGGTAYSLLILRADADFADFGRYALNAVIRPHAVVGEKVWFPNQFSANWYAAPAGAELLVSLQKPKRGDLLVVGGEWDIKATLDKFPSRTLVQALEHECRF